MKETVGERMSLAEESVMKQDEKAEVDSVSAKPGLTIIHARWVEDLAEELKKRLRNARKEKGAFETLEVAVANPNLGNWLKMKVLMRL